MKTLSMILLLSVLLAASAQAQEIYRVVDEHGNVTYTDQKPDDDAEPMVLPELNVLEGGADALPEVDPANDTAAPQQAMNFRIEQPADGQTITLLGSSLKVIMASDIDIPPSAEIVLILDGQALKPVHSLETGVHVSEPGLHRLEARLQTPSGRLLGGAGPVIFSTAPPVIE